MDEIEFNREVGAAIREARLGCKMTQSDLARLCDLSTTRLSNIETAHARVSAYQLWTISRALHTDIINSIEVSEDISCVNSFNIHTSEGILKDDTIKEVQKLVIGIIGKSRLDHV